VLARDLTALPGADVRGAGHAIVAGRRTGAGAGGDAGVAQLAEGVIDHAVAAGEAAGRGADRVGDGVTVIAVLAATDHAVAADRGGAIDRGVIGGRPEVVATGGEREARDARRDEQAKVHGVSPETW
jgi:hypothetical protein